MQAQNIVKLLVAIAVIGILVNVAAGYGLAYHISLRFNSVAVTRSLGTLAVFLVPYFLWRPHQLRQWWANGWNLQAAEALHAYRTPCMVEVLYILAGVLPDSVVALQTHAVLMNVNIILYMTFYGIAVAASIRVGNCLGAGPFKKAKMASYLFPTISPWGKNVVFGHNRAWRGGLASRKIQD